MKNAILSITVTALFFSGALNWCFFTGKLQMEAPDITQLADARHGGR